MPKLPSTVTRIYNKTRDRIESLAKSGFIPLNLFSPKQLEDMGLPADESEKGWGSGDAAVIDYLIYRLEGYIEKEREAESLPN